MGLLMVAVSLPYGAASPILGILSDKYPVNHFHVGHWLNFCASDGRM